MHNIQDLKEKIFFDSKNMISILGKINYIDELISKQDLVDELADRISFLRLLEKNIEYYGSQNFSQDFASDHVQELRNEVIEEEAIFNNELNEINEGAQESFSVGATEEEAIFNNQLNEIVEGELHETLINFAEENGEGGIDEISEKGNLDEVTEEEAIFNNQLNEIDQNESSEYSGGILDFVDEERILADSEPEHDKDIDEDMFNEKTTQEEALFNNQLNEIDEFENEISDHEGNVSNDFNEEQKIQDHFQSEVKNDQNNSQTAAHQIPSIFDIEPLEDEDLLIEENEEQFTLSDRLIEQGEMPTDTTNAENIVIEIKNESMAEEKQEQSILAEINDRRKIVEINRGSHDTEKDTHASDESFENLDAYQQEKKIKLANIKGLKAVQSLFGDDHLEIKWPEEKTTSTDKEDNVGSLLKTNISTGFMEAEKKKPEFKLDLNDKIAFSKTLFGGSQSELNEVIARLNSFKTLEEAKEYLSDLYYSRKWNKVDEYAQRLWILVENKFL
ncbi:hypothetical protein MKJ01_03655 [Chryseobacterium sp. SSA4.19]|uniref:hypothetical protein n=1 Tax=Chryseobacterium sp. SSA4.19 TaxID=2919915 RepID=UPI001F4DAF35|nr:hypothetical protein [Chryseobacterium sp. SSA4.19]MCJ8152859.1 hypothetical protein [Chryseobacterium sp. SSA4.19]